MKKFRMEMVMACLLLVSFYLLSRQAAVVSVQMNFPKLILIDPGHGEDDPGMIGADGLEEKGINLAISLLLKSELETRGYSVAMTRETDKGLYDASANNKKAQDMQRRIAMIGEKSPVLSVSIHQNSYQQDASVHGPQVFYYESSVEGKKLAEAVQSSLNEKLEIDRPREIKGNQGKYQLLSAQKKSRNACDRRMWFPDQSRRGQKIADRIVSAKSSGCSGRWN